MMNLLPQEKFETLGLSLPPAPAPLGIYKPFLVDGKVSLFVRTWPVQMINHHHRKNREDMDIEQGSLPQDR